MRKIFIPILFSLLAFSTFSFKSSDPSINTQDEQGINWLTWEEAIEKSKKEKRKILVDVYTEWCVQCKRMDDDTFSDKVIINYINEHYYAIKFDAEYKEVINLNDESYKYIKKGERGYHELAASMTKGKLTFPSIVFLDENLSIIQSLGGFQKSEKFEAILVYFATNNHKKTPWSKFERNFRSLHTID